MECKLRSVNFRRVSNPGRVFRPTFGITGISDDWYKSTMGVIVMSLRTHQCTRENFGALGSTRERWQQVWEQLESQWSSLGKTSSLETPMVCLEIIATIHRSTIIKSHVFSLYSHLCIYIATHLRMVYLDWLQAALESNPMRTWKWWSSQLSNTLQGLDRVRLEMHLEVVIQQVWRYTWRPQWCELGLFNQVSVEIQLEAAMVRTSRL